MSIQTKILVTYHQPAPLLKGDMFVPINGGRANLKTNLANSRISEEDYKWLIDNTIGDDIGENISKDNGRYNEMTVLYWAWKNYEKLGDPDYIGLMHYRRHFIFKDWVMPKGERWTFDYSFFNEDYLRDLNCEPESVQEYLSKYDCLYAYYPLKLTVYEHYKTSPAHRIEELDFIVDTIKKDFPDIYPSAQAYVNGYNQYFCNMFIMKKLLFNKYCEFAFSLLSKFDKWRDTSLYSVEEMRFFISERITGIFIQYLIDKGEKCCPLNISFLENTEIKKSIKPAYKTNNIPVIFSVDDRYAPYLGVTLSSLIKNSKAINSYDIFILYCNLSGVNKEKLKSLIEGYSNICMRFIDITPYMADINIDNLYLEIQHISIATYYRFMIAKIFSNYRKVIYLDSDLIINCDIAELYQQNIQNNWVGAVVDIRESIPVKLDSHHFGCSWKYYVSNVLGLDNPYKYFQAGVLIVNVEQFIKDNVTEKLFDMINKIQEPYLQDQDILNAVCYKHVSFIPVSWNIEWQISFEYPNYRQILLADFYKQYSAALKNKKIIHYASPVKPWNEPDRYLADYWWKYARLTPYYEELIKNMSNLRKTKSTIKNIENGFHTSFIEKIFSLKNSVSKRHKIITIFGIHFKIKRMSKNKKCTVRG